MSNVVSSKVYNRNVEVQIFDQFAESLAFPVIHSREVRTIPRQNVASKPTPALSTSEQNQRTEVISTNKPEGNKLVLVRASATSHSASMVRKISRWTNDTIPAYIADKICSNAISLKKYFEAMPVSCCFFY